MDADPALEAPPGASTDLRVEPRRLSETRITLLRWIERLSAWLGGRAFYRSRFLAPGRTLVRFERIDVVGLPEGLDGFRIAQLSDLHAGPFLGTGDLAHVVERVNAERPDLVVITGDLITRRWDEALCLLPDWAHLAPRYGVLGVFGNHDYHQRGEGRIAGAYREAGIELLRDECRRIDTGRGVLAVVGLEDLEESRGADLERARRGLEPDDVELVLCHNPGGAPKLARPGCVAVLSGHTHGCQVNLPLVRRMGPQHPGNRLRYGDTTLIVSRGLGVVCVPLRVFAPAEVVLIELHRAAPRSERGSERGSAGGGVGDTRRAG